MNAYTGPPGFPGWLELGANVPKMTNQGSKTSLRLSIANYFGASWNGFYTIPATVGAFGTHWGINRTMAQIHALLLVSADPLTQDDIMEELNMQTAAQLWL